LTDQAGVSPASRVARVSYDAAVTVSRRVVRKGVAADGDPWSCVARVRG